MADIRSVPVADLLFDAENPRLSQPNIGQRDALRAIAQSQQKKLVALASHILEHGINPAELTIATPLAEDTARFVALEGNRRLAALKALENPESLVGAVDPPVLADLRKLSSQYQASPIDSVNVIVVADRDEARPWIHLRHTGQNEGAGVVPWGSDEATRFGARSNSFPISTQALNLLESRGLITAAARRLVPATSFKRILDTQAVRDRVGIEFRGGQLHLRADIAAVAKALHHIARELIDGKVPVQRIYTKALREKYAREIPSSVAVRPTVPQGEGLLPTNSAPLKKKPVAKPRKVRDQLIPRDCVLSVSDERSAQIEDELRAKLSLDRHTNAVAVLFRVFLELSADVYVRRTGLKTAGPDAPLAAKLTSVREDLIAKQKLTKLQAKPVRRACQKDSFLAPSIGQMHQWVHNQHAFPAPADLRAHWDNLQPFLIAIWSP